MKKLILLLLLFVSLPSLAKRQFDIEMIVFKRNIDAEKTSESWPNQLETIDLSKAHLFSDGYYRTTKGVQILPASSYHLIQQYNDLNNNAKYKVLLHTAWRQGDQGKAYAPIFHIRAGKDYSDQFNPDGSKITDVNNAFAGPLYELEGRFQVYVQHYLFSEITLDLKQPAKQRIPFKAKESKELLLTETDEETTPTSEIQTVLKSYRFDQKRRIRSGETHYLDHPLMGIILQIRKAP